jgi:hypothetical protein
MCGMIAILIDQISCDKQNYSPLFYCRQNLQISFACCGNLFNKDFLSPKTKSAKSNPGFNEQLTSAKSYLVATAKKVF